MCSICPDLVVFSSQRSVKPGSLNAPFAPQPQSQYPNLPNPNRYSLEALLQSQSQSSYRPNDPGRGSGGGQMHIHELARSQTQHDQAEFEREKVRYQHLLKASADELQGVNTMNFKLNAEVCMI